MTTIAVVSDLIGAVYDAALEPALWPEVLERMAGVIRSKSASIQMIDPSDQGKLIYSVDYGSDPKWVELLHTTYAALCPIGPILLFAEVDEPSTMFDFIDEDEFLETRFYKEWCHPQDVYHFGGTLLSKTPMNVTSLSFIRGRAAPRFNSDEYELMGLLSPHVRRATVISGLLKHQAVELAGLSEVMNQLSTAILIVDAKGRLLETNPAAEALLAREGAKLLSDGRLALASGAADGGTLERAISQCNGRAELVPLEDPSRASRLTAAVMPIDAGRTRFAVLVHTPAPLLPAMGRPLAKAFGFTPREVAVLMLLLEGKTIGDIAAILGVSLATVRTHVGRLLEKTGTERQADLVRAVMQAMPPVQGM